MSRPCPGRSNERGSGRAQTPQLFAFGILLRALQNCPDLDAVTDESSAVERIGFRPPGRALDRHQFEGDDAGRLAPGRGGF